MKVVNSHDALIDKVIINKFYIRKIGHFEEMVARGMIQIRNKPETKLDAGRGNKYSLLKIGKTDMFDSLVYGLSPDSRIFGMLEISVSDNEDHCNLNCYTVEQLRQRIDAVKRYLRDTYGMDISFEKAGLKSVEINKTIALSQDSAAYNRVLKLINHSYPGTLRLKLKDHKTDEEDDDNQSFYRDSGRDGIKVKLYSKTKQLAKKGIITDEEYFRLEITLKSGKKVRDKLGTNEISRISQDGINAYYEDFVTENIQKPFEKWWVRSMKYAEKTVKEHYVKGNHSWRSDCLLYIADEEIRRGYPLILDLDQVTEVLGVVIDDKRDRHYHRRRFIETSREEAPFLMNDDESKLQELISKFHS